MRVLGFTDFYNNCDCCGRNNLKGTYAVESSTGYIYHFGSTCVSKKEWFNNDISLKNQCDEYALEIKIKAIEMFDNLGGYLIKEKMKKLNAFTDEHDMLYKELNYIEKQCNDVFLSEFVKYILY